MPSHLELLWEMTDAAKDISHKAGAILMKGFRSRATTISYKSRTDMVTSMDGESERFICSEIWKRFPEHAIVAEEGSGRDSGCEYLWYVDPLDATNNYAHGIPFFCVSIAAISRSSGTVVCGAVYDPCHDELFHAVSGGGSFLNGESIKVSDTADHGIALFSTGFPYAKSDMEHNNLKELNRILPEIQCVRRLGSAALDLCYTACGRVDGYWEPMLKPWDTAAGSLILTEAGGRVSRYNGDPFDPEFPEIAATNGKLHSYLVGMLTGSPI
ncbi:MAG TPA: inositol monophosphatase family protein [Spirochaetota bacterium]|nr:inositol monophosphatase family protein [Spirochaetota bacterium]